MNSDRVRTRRPGAPAADPHVTHLSRLSRLGSGHGPRSASPGRERGARTGVRKLLSAQSGRPLDTGVRRDMERRLGGDFSRVRVHTGETAQASAASLQAMAYTVGRDVAFASGAYDPASDEGRGVLAHELVHVMQNGGANGGAESGDRPVGALRLSDPADAEEREAEEAVRAVASGARARVTRRSAPGRVARCGGTTHPGCACAEDEPVVHVQRFEPPPARRPPVRMPPVRTAPGRPAAPGSAPPAAEYTDPGYDDMGEALEQQGKRDRTVIDAEVPRATLERGGKPPDFLTLDGYGVIVGEAGQVRHRKFAFHILDAIEYEVDRATTDEEIEAVAAAYIPTRKQSAGRAPRPVPRAPALDPRRVVIPSTLDPGGEARLEVYGNAVRKKTKRAPKLATTALPQGGCTMRMLRGFLGNDPVATLYCQMATGTENEVRVMPPGDPRGVVYDAIRENTVYECKCGYGSLVKALGQDRFWAQWRADGLDEQVQRHRRVAQECGLQYRYMVSNKEFAELLRRRWFGVTVIHEPSELCD
ncbi:DUF4157 domain-containing protein [Streptomyces sp. NRRL B-1677]|nr:DUF4157 domain-containing protein [Streptomyces sp. NRRL B-1677]